MDGNRRWSVDKSQGHMKVVVGKKKITTKDVQRRSTPVETQTFISNGCKVQSFVQSWTFSSLFFLIILKNMKSSQHKIYPELH